MHQLDNALAFLEEHMGEENIVGKFNYIYSMTTENIKGYINKINNINAVLTVGASGDHALNCIAAGAEYVRVFDRNPAALYITQLKIAALALSRNEFIDYFILEDAWDVPSDKFFAFETYLKFADNLPDDGRVFWDRFYTKLHENKVTPQTSEFFGHTRYSREDLIGANLYFEAGMYETLQRRAKCAVVTYIHANVTELNALLPEGERYNAILFSNISDYLDGLFPEAHAWNRMELFDKFTTEFAKNRLAFDGEFYYAYIYRATTGPGWTEIDDVKNLPKKLTPFEYKTFPAMCRHMENQPSWVDCVLFKRRNICEFE